jgi:hypothetical protein
MLLRMLLKGDAVIRTDECTRYEVGTGLLHTDNYMQLEKDIMVHYLKGVREKSASAGQ